MNGILFKQQMIEAIMRDVNSKTVTRRTDGLKEINLEPGKWHWVDTLNNKFAFAEITQVTPFMVNINMSSAIWVKPRYHAGQIVYVKETWATMKLYDDLSPSELTDTTPIWFKDTDVDKPTGCGDDMGRWRSPMFLPEKYARTFLKIVDVRPERFDITKLSSSGDGDYEKEGGDAAIPMLSKINGLWCFRIEFKLERIK
jgi:hypothetical protein